MATDIHNGYIHYKLTLFHPIQFVWLTRFARPFINAPRFVRRRPNDNYAFELSSGGRVFKIRAHNLATKNAWIENIEEQIDNLLLHRTSSLAGGLNGEQGEGSTDAIFITRVIGDCNLNKLNMRSKIIYDFACDLKQFRHDLSLLKSNFIDPLKVMSKGE